MKSLRLPEKMAHAYILKGRDQAELLHLARSLAARSNCLAEESRRPCGVCENCRRIFTGVYEDWFYLEPQGAGDLIRIGQVRRLQEDLNVKARAGRIKIGVLNRAHRMQEAGQNCLLKTLEEPPSDSLLLLLTDRPQDLLPTVLSRCQVLSAGGEEPAAAREDLELAADSLAEIERRGLAAVFERAEFIQGSRKKALPEFLSALELLLRNALRANWPAGGPEIPLTAAGAGEASLAKREKAAPAQEEAGPSLPPKAPGACLAALEAVWKAGYLLDRNVNPLLILENLFLALYRNETEKS
ncbi:MAG: hypothetical protein VB085_07700 [Peptococcaceae bacterium]|nr:hypothetical protein [Peptococcaceae bacterium]